MGIRQKSRKSKKRRWNRTHKRSVRLICTVILLLVVVVSVNGMALRAKEKDLKAQEIELQKQIDEEKARTEEIEELEEYVGTDEYVEEVAKEKLGLVWEDEIIFKAD